MDKNCSGIYAIKNIVNGKKYIGQSVDLGKRNGDHFSMLRGNYHHNRYLQNSYNKYGEGAFEFKILEHCDEEVLTEREQFFVDIHAPEELYNIRLECVDSNFGMSFSEATKKKMSEAKSGENHPRWGKTASKETRKKMSEANLGKTHSEETRKKLSEMRSGENNPNYGKSPSEEARKKMSEAQRGRTHSEETRKKMSENHADFSGENGPFYKKTHSKESRKKMSESKSGENHPNSKLLEKNVVEIKELLKEKVTQKKIAEIYGVSLSTISRINTGENWKHIK